MLNGVGGGTKKKKQRKRKVQNSGYEKLSACVCWQYKQTLSGNIHKKMVIVVSSKNSSLQ